MIEYYFNFVVRNHIKKGKEKNPFRGQARANRAANDLHVLNDAVVIVQLTCQVHQPVDISMVSSGIRISLQYIYGEGVQAEIKK